MNIKFGLMNLIPLFILSLSFLSFVYLGLPSIIIEKQDTLSATEFGNAYPFKTQGSAIISNRTHLLFFGGSDDAWDGNTSIMAVKISDLYNLQPSGQNLNLFDKVGDLPYPVYDMGVIKDGNFVYLFGGFHNNSKINSIMKCDISQYPYHFNIVQNLPYGLENPKVLRYNQEVYIFGGSNYQLGDNQRNVFLFNLNNNSLNNLNVKTPNFSPDVGYFNNKIYVFGGLLPSDYSYSTSMYVFNPETKSFNQIGNLPDSLSSFDISHYFIYNSKLIFYYKFNSDHFSNFPSVYDLNTRKLVNYNLPILKGGSSFNYLQNNQAYLDSNLNLWLFGGQIPYELISKYSVYSINMTTIFGNLDTISNSMNTINSQTVNNQSVFLKTSNDINFNFTSLHSQYIRPINTLTLNPSDTISIKAKYMAHSDDNSRQRIEIGFTFDTPIKQLNLYNTIPSTNFIGIQIQNAASNSDNYAYIGSRIVKDNVSILNKFFYYNRSQDHDIDFRFTLINTTAYYYSLSVDGNLNDEILQGNLNNIKLNSFAIWNENNSYLNLQGFYKGEVSSAFLIHNKINQDQNLKDIIGLLIFLNFFLILVLIYVIRSPRFKYLATGTKPEGIPNSLINLGFYNLYLSLKKAFEKLEKISRVGLEDDSKDISLSSKFSFINESEEYIISEAGIEDLTGLSMKILIHLLDYLDHGTYLSNVQINLDISRSSFYYTINKLKEKGFIDINTQITDDQRKKFVVISPKGFNLLKVVYNHLDSYFNNQK